MGRAIGFFSTFFFRSVALFFFLLLGCAMLMGQGRRPLGDTIGYQQYYAALVAQFGLQADAGVSSPAVFRYWNGHQVLEYVDMAGVTRGSIVSYARRLRKSRKDRETILFEKASLDSASLAFVGALLRSSRIDRIPSQRDIKGWANGFDGMSYQFEYHWGDSAKLASYWMPEIVDLPQARSVAAFVQQLEDSLAMDTLYLDFRSRWPKRGCYLLGSMTTLCYASAQFHLGYSGSQLMPWGFTLGKGFFVGSRGRSVFLQIRHRWHRVAQRHDLLAELNFSSLLRSSKPIDFVTLSYRNRRVAANLPIGRHFSQNVQLVYGLQLHDLDIAVGGDFLQQQAGQSAGPRVQGNFSGFHVAAVYAKASLMPHGLDLDAGISKFIPLRDSFVKGFSVELFTERFQERVQYGVQLAVAL